MSLLNLVASLTLDSTKYEQGLEGALNKANNFSSVAKGIGKGMFKAAEVSAKVGAAAMTAVVSATTAVTGAMVKGTAETAAYGDNIDKMSQKMGLSAQAYQEWDAVMQHSGTSMEALKAGMKTLANAVESGNDAFERLGISQEQIASMNQEELFSATISALQNVENETERTYLAGQLLGRGATELGALLNTSAEDTQAMKDRVHELGGVMSDEAVKASAKFQDNLQDMQTAIAGVKRGITGEFLPGLNGLMEGFTMLIAGEEGAEEALTGGFDKILEAFGTVTDRLVPMAERIIPIVVEGIATGVPQLFNTAYQLVSTLLEAIINNAPTLIVAAEGIVQTIGNGIITNIPTLVPKIADLFVQLAQAALRQLPLIIEVGLQVIIALAQGIAESIPDLVPTIVEVALEIVQVLIDNAPMLLDAAIQIIIALGEGLISSLPMLIDPVSTLITEIVATLIEKAVKLKEATDKIIDTMKEGLIAKISVLKEAGRQMMESVKSTIMEKVNAAKQWGSDLIGNFINGIKQKWEDLKNTVSGAAGIVGSYLHFSEPDEGPLKNFHTYAPDMMKLFAQGIKDNEHLVTDQIDRSFDFGDQIVGATPAVSGAPVTVNVYGAQGQDERAIAEEVMKRLRREYDRGRAVYA